MKIKIEHSVWHDMKKTHGFMSEAVFVTEAASSCHLIRVIMMILCMKRRRASPLLSLSTQAPCSCPPPL